MSSALEFLFLIVIIHGGCCHEKWKRQSDGSGSPSEHTISTESGNTAAGELSTSDKVALGVGLGVGIPTLLLTCISIIAGANWCRGKSNNGDRKPEREGPDNSVPKAGSGGGGQVINIGEQKVEGAGNAGVANARSTDTATTVRAFDAPVTHHHYHGK